MHFDSQNFGIHIQKNPNSPTLNQLLSRFHKDTLYFCLFLPQFSSARFIWSSFSFFFLFVCLFYSASSHHLFKISSGLFNQLMVYGGHCTNYNKVTFLGSKQRRRWNIDGGKVMCRTASGEVGVEMWTKCRDGRRDKEECLAVRPSII